MEKGQSVKGDSGLFLCDPKARKNNPNNIRYINFPQYIPQIEVGTQILLTHPSEFLFVISGRFNNHILSKASNQSAFGASGKHNHHAEQTPKFLLFSSSNYE